MKHHANDLIMLFNDLFRETDRTLLVSGGEEPEYIPARTPDGLAQVMFAYDYYASALHEISHWCIAGAQRRKLHDYGYWYCPDGRNAEQQMAFEKVEVKPQALEWLFSVAAGSRFHVSVDNLTGSGTDEKNFREKVWAQTQVYLREGLPDRADRFYRTLLVFYKRQTPVADAWSSEQRFHDLNPGPNYEC